MVVLVSVIGREEIPIEKSKESVVAVGKALDPEKTTAKIVGLPVYSLYECKHRKYNNSRKKENKCNGNIIIDLKKQ